MIPLPRTPRTTPHALCSPDRTIGSVMLTDLIELAPNLLEARLAVKTSVHARNSARLQHIAACNTALGHTCARARMLAHYSNPIMNPVDFIEVSAKWGQSRPMMGTAQPTNHTSQPGCDRARAVSHTYCCFGALWQEGRCGEAGWGVANRK